MVNDLWGDETNYLVVLEMFNIFNHTSKQWNHTISWCVVSRNVKIIRLNDSVFTQTDEAVIALEMMSTMQTPDFSFMHIFPIIFSSYVTAVISNCSVVHVNQQVNHCAEIPQEKPLFKQLPTENVRFSLAGAQPWHIWL